MRSGQHLATPTPTPTPLTNCAFVLLAPLLLLLSFFRATFVLLLLYWTRWLLVYHMQVLTGRVLDACASIPLVVL